MAAGDIYQTVCSGLLQGQRVENVLHHIVDADASDDALSHGLFLWARNTWLPAVVGIQSDEFLWDNVTITKIWPTPPLVPSINAITYPGTIGSSSMPSEVSATLTKVTRFGGPKYRGRCYFAGIPAAWLDPATGLFSASFIAAGAAIEPRIADSVPSSPVGGTLTPIIYHRADHGATQIRKGILRVIPRSQRRRQVGRGI